MLLGIAWLFIFPYQPSENQAFPWVSNLFVSITDNVTTPGVYPDCITNHIALIVLTLLLIVLLWLYCFGHILDCIALINCLHYLILKFKWSKI